MKIKKYIISTILSIIIVGLYNVNYGISSEENVYERYKIYLGNEEIGYIDDDDKLYDLINAEQQGIKSLYGVDNVYPPEDFKVIRTNTFEESVISVDEVYKQIENAENFTIKGYTISIKYPDVEDDGIVLEDIEVNVLSKEVFDGAINKLVEAFIDPELYDDYINDTQEEIVDTGEIVNAMYFLEDLSIRENYISVDETIYTDVDALTQYFLYGDVSKIKNYTIELGDTIETISNDNKLNTKEFLIGNPSYRDENTLLLVGDTVNVTLPSPIINFVYDVTKTSEIEMDFVNTVEYDYSKPYGYEEIVQHGVTGISRVTQDYQVTNGIQSQGSENTIDEVIRESVNQITIKGPVSSGGGSSSVNSGSLNTGLSFVPAVDSGAWVTSGFAEWRSGVQHTGTDYSGTGANSPIYAIADGVVTQVVPYCGYVNCSSRWSGGNYIVISHGNNYYSSYLHMYKGSMTVSVGDTVTAGQRIGGMGNTGWSTGTHLHLGFSIGEPYTSDSVKYYNAHTLIYGR